MYIFLEDVTARVFSYSPAPLVEAACQTKGSRVARLETVATSGRSGSVGKNALAKAREKPGRGRNIRQVSTGFDYCRGHYANDLPFELRQGLSGVDGASWVTIRKLSETEVAEDPDRKTPRSLGFPSFQGGGSCPLRRPTPTES